MNHAEAPARLTQVADTDTDTETEPDAPLITPADALLTEMVLELLADPVVRRLAGLPGPTWR